MGGSSSQWVLAEYDLSETRLGYAHMAHEQTYLSCSAQNNDINNFTHLVFEYTERQRQTCTCMP